MLGGVRIVALSICSHEQTNKTESADFLYEGLDGGGLVFTIH